MSFFLNSYLLTLNSMNSYAVHIGVLAQLESLQRTENSAHAL